MSRQDSQVFEFGTFRLVPQEHLLLNEGKPVSLTPKSFDLLRVLVENAGHLVEKRELMDLVWPDSFVEEANLSVKMSEIRRALGEAPNEQRFIETVPRRGYRFVAEVSERTENGTRTETAPVDESGSSPIAPETPSAPATVLPRELPGRGSLHRGLLIGVSTAVLLAALVFVLDIGGLKSRLIPPADQTPIRSIAVLPLQNLSGDQSQEYFADGMTEALITHLAKVRSLQVPSRTSVMQYKGVQQPLPEIARKLNVDAVVEGSVQRFGDRVKITVQLIHAPADRHLWSQTYERDLHDVLALQNEIARTITQQIQINLSPQEQTSLASYPRQVDPEAYDRFLLGKYYANRQSDGDNKTTIAMFERSVAADPTFAAAYAELAQAYVWRIHLFAPAEPGLKEKAFVATEKALALDPNLAAAYLARGRLQWTLANHFPHEEAIREYRRALALDPNLDEARNQLAVVFNHIGALDKALREVQQAVATNPGNSVARFRVGETLLFQGKFDEAVTALRSAPDEANPALSRDLIVWGLWNLGRKDEAAATLNQYLAENPEDNRGLLTSIQAVMAAASGRNEEAEKKIREAIEKGKGFGHFHHTEFQIACAYARMNKPQQALEFLEAAARDGFPCYPLFEVDPNLDSLRQNPDLVTFLAELRKQWETRKAEL